jgi:hypothetical protein
MKIKLICLTMAVLLSGMFASSRNCNATCNKIGKMNQKTASIAWAAPEFKSAELGHNPMAHFFQMEI